MSKITVHRRNSCRVCGDTDLLRWVHLPQMPLTDDLRLPGDIKEEFVYDMDVFYCSSCQTSQILHDIDFNEYYVDYQYTVGESQHANKFMSKLASTLLDRYQLPKNSSVLEIGSGDGAQLLFFKKLGSNVYGFEPSEVLCSVSESIGVPVYHGLFTEDSVKHVPEEYKPADIVLLTYTFDHIPEPVGFLHAVKQIMNPQTGLLVIEVHDLDKIMKRREYCLFEHEHSIYLSSRTMQKVLNQNGFRLISTNLLNESDRRGNSLLIVAAGKDSVYVEEEHELFQNNENELSQYELFNKEMLEGIKRLDDFVDAHVKAGRHVAGYGAGGRGVMTLAAMNSAGKLSYVCDQNPNFCGRVTPKSHVPVVLPSKLSEDPVDVLLVFSFGYIEEIRTQIAGMKNGPAKIVSMLEVL